MKCPQCGFLCSDLRDICGKCFVDLRPRKEQLGIKIIRPDASYDELVEKVAKKVQARQEVRQQGGLLGSLMSMIGSPPQTETVTKWEAIEKAEAPIEESDPLPAPTPQTRPEPSVTAPRAKSAPKAVKFKRSSTALDVSAQTAPSNIVPLAPSPLDAFSIEELWGETYNAITFNGGAAEFEFQTSQLRSYAPEKEEIEILWALSDEAIQDPNSQRRFQEIAKSDSRKVEAETAKKMLEKVEKSLVAQVFSLKRGGPKLTKQDEAVSVAAEVRLAAYTIDPASRGERISAGLIDLGYIALLAALITFASAWFLTPEIRGGLLRPSSMPAPEFTAIALIFLAISLALGFLYPWFAGTRTAGQKLYGLAVVECTGRDASQKELFLRSAMLPLSSLLGFLVPPLWSKLGFHNHFSNTVVTRLSAEN